MEGVPGGAGVGGAGRGEEGLEVQRPLTAEDIRRFLGEAHIAAAIESIAETAGYDLVRSDASGLAERIATFCAQVGIGDPEVLLSSLFAFAGVGGRYVFHARPKGAVVFGGSSEHLLALLLLGQRYSVGHPEAPRWIAPLVGASYAETIPAAVAAVERPEDPDWERFCATRS